MVDIEFDYTSSTQFVKLYDYFDALIAVGGYLAFFWWIFYLIMPLFALSYLIKLAKVIQAKSAKTYREELNELAHKSISQL